MSALALLVLIPLIVIGFASFVAVFVGLVRLAEAMFENDTRRAVLGTYILATASFLLALALVAIRSLTGGAL